VARGDILTYFDNRKWHNIFEGDDEPFSDHFTKGDAWASGLREALRLRVDHEIRTENGQVLERTRYRHDDEADDLDLGPQVLRDIDAELRGRPAGEILSALTSRLPSGDSEGRDRA
jgi:hypothetical protein